MQSYQSKGRKECDIMKKKEYTSGMKFDDKLLVLFLIIAACVALAYYVGFIMGEEIVYTHFFYIPIILAGMWYSVNV